jgi:type IV pilus assembly protein PilV
MEKAMNKVTLQSGFSMLEVLVTLVVVGTALLGTAGLQAYAMKMNKGSEFRNQAIFLSGDIVERMEANKFEVINGNYTVAANAPGVAPTRATCPLAGCNPAQLAAFDLSNWQADAAVLPKGAAEIACPAANPATCTIIIRWTDRGSAESGQVAPETFSITTTKLIRG